MSQKKQTKEISAFGLNLYSSLISILMGLLFGAILLFIFNPSKAPNGISNLLFTGFASKEKFAKVLYQTGPLMLCGLSVGMAFKTSLFNIGAPGQYTVGAMVALIFALHFKASWGVCLLMAAIAGAIWGMFPGLFKAYFNVNVVITTIMLNWVGLFLTNVVVSNVSGLLACDYGSPIKNRTAGLAVGNVNAIIPHAGLDKLFNSGSMNISIFICIAVAYLCHVILNKTTFGYELKACGFNADGAKYAGINEKANIVYAMMIAGALAGLGGGIYYLAGTAEYLIEKNLLSMGFDGIPVALLAHSEPLGTILAALFISFIRVGGQAMQPDFSPEYIDVILSAIIYFAAFSLLIKEKIVARHKRKALGSEKEAA